MCVCVLGVGGDTEKLNPDGGLKFAKLSWRMNLWSFKFECEPHLQAFTGIDCVAIRMNETMKDL